MFHSQTEKVRYSLYRALSVVVAVCGLPDARKDHAIAMCRFASEAMLATWHLTTELTQTLGPGMFMDCLVFLSILVSALLMALLFTPVLQKTQAT